MSGDTTPRFSAIIPVPDANMEPGAVIDATGAVVKQLGVRVVGAKVKATVGEDGKSIVVEITQEAPDLAMEIHPDPATVGRYSIVRP